jgi:phospholipid/cholesterol/gamma-HCH transport system substrate-binding protein
MSTERKGTEIYVGLFLLIGFSFLAVMVIHFGRLGQGMTDFYQISVEFPNASGLVKGSDVLLSGAQIGHVATAPELTGESYAVMVQLKIRENIKIPIASTFMVGSSGLLGDRFVDVQLRPKFDATAVIPPDAVIRGTRAGGGLNELTEKGGDVMDQLSAELETIQQMTQRLNEGLLHEQNLKNLEATFENLRASTESFKETAKGLDKIVSKAEMTVDSATKTMQTADGAAADLRLALEDIRKMTESADETVKSAQVLVKKASEGEGTLGALINDERMAQDLKALVGNLRRTGVLFYKDRTPRATPPPKPPARKRR